MKDLILSSLSLLLALLLIAMAAFFLPPMLEGRENVQAAASDAPVLVIDAGHGGRDGGATVAGVTEKGLNLDIALRVAALCRAAGVTVLLTRDGDYALGEDIFDVEFFFEITK